MGQIIPVSHDEDRQAQVPSAWRDTFTSIVSSFVSDDFSLKNGVPAVRSISSEDARRMKKNIENYGARLIHLPEQSWDSSVCQKMCSYWDVLVDLFTEEEGRSDLVLIARVYENHGCYEFEVHSVHVP